METIKKKCEKCESTFIVQRRKLKDGSLYVTKREKRFCSRSCANSHIFTEERRNAISNGLKGNIPWNKGKGVIKPKIYCIDCNKEITYKSKTKRCRYCANTTAEFRKSQSVKLKEQYRLGREVYGGTTKWLKYKDLKVQGTYEIRACIILDKMLELGEIDSWEYTNDRIKYIGEDNKEHRYLLDFKVNNSYYIETKGYIRDLDIIKWNAAESQGIVITKWFLEELEREEKRLNIK